MWRPPCQTAQWPSLPERSNENATAQRGDNAPEIRTALAKTCTRAVASAALGKKAPGKSRSLSYIIPH